MKYDAVVFLESLFQLPAVVPGDLPADWHVLWDERAAIMEYDGGLPRELAEHLALTEVVRQMAEAQHPGAIPSSSP